MAACRIYSTAAFALINGPLRDQGRSEAHPLPITVSFLAAAIGKLRVVGAHESRTAIDLWRGMRDMSVPDSFRQHGGTELAPMSTTSDLAVALRYSRSERALIFKLRSDSFMNRGASIAFLSAFAAEQEVIYPPLTFINPTGREETVTVGRRGVLVVEVVPHFGSA